MTSAQRQEHLLTEEEYFELEERSDSKYEFWNGHVVLMAGAASIHNRIVNRIEVALSNRLVDTKCEITSSDQKIKARAGVFTLPDVVVSCEDEQFDPIRTHVLLNPHILVEVLSPSTGATDVGVKLAAYQSLPSLLDYLIVWTDMVRVEHYARQNATDWRFRRLLNRNEQLESASHDLRIPVAEFYRRLDIPEGVLTFELPAGNREDDGG